MKGYKLECCFSSKDDYVLSCSEDGFVYCWDLVEVSFNEGLFTLFVYCILVFTFFFFFLNNDLSVCQQILDMHKLSDKLQFDVGYH